MSSYICVISAFGAVKPIYRERNNTFYWITWDNSQKQTRFQAQESFLRTEIASLSTLDQPSNQSTAALSTLPVLWEFYHGPAAEEMKWVESIFTGRTNDIYILFQNDIWAFCCAKPQLVDWWKINDLPPRHAILLIFVYCFERFRWKAPRLSCIIFSEASWSHLVHSYVKAP